MELWLSLGRERIWLLEWAFLWMTDGLKGVKRGMKEKREGWITTQLLLLSRSCYDSITTSTLHLLVAQVVWMVIVG